MANLEDLEAERRRRENRIALREDALRTQARLNCITDFDCLVPYKVIYDWLHKEAFTPIEEKKDLPIMPNKYYPNPARSKKLASLCRKSIKAIANGVEDEELKRKIRILDAKERLQPKMELMQYYFARFFKDYDFWEFKNEDWVGVPISEQEEMEYRKTFIAYQKDYLKNPSKYDHKEYKRKKEHEVVFDLYEGYM